jgi:hypothetical protein
MYNGEGREEGKERKGTLNKHGHVSSTYKSSSGGDSDAMTRLQQDIKIRTLVS